MLDNLSILVLAATMFLSTSNSVLAETVTGGTSPLFRLSYLFNNSLIVRLVGRGEKLTKAIREAEKATKERAKEEKEKKKYSGSSAIKKEKMRIKEEKKKSLMSGGEEMGKVEGEGEGLAEPCQDGQAVLCSAGLVGGC